DIINTAVLELVHYPQPEFGAFVLLESQAEHLLGAIGADTQRDVDGLVADHPFVADLDPDRIEEDQRINRIEWPCCQVATSSRTASVTVEIRSGDTSMPYRS